MSNTIKWTEIDRNDLPEDEVLVVSKSGYLMLGQLCLQRGKVVCEGEGEAVCHDPTHYITEEDLLGLPGF